MIMDVTTIQAKGRQVIWDGTNLDEVREVAADRFRGVYETMAIVENEDGGHVHLPQGWAVTRLETGKVVVSSPGGAKVLFREIV
jgi:hypothetical protein